MTSASKTILIIDDEPDIGEAVAMALSLEGFETKVAHNRSSTLDCLGSLKPAVALLDYYIPDLPAEELVAVIKLHFPSAQLVLMTAGNYPEEKARALGVEHLLRKPFELDDMLALVRELTLSASD